MKLKFKATILFALQLVLLSQHFVSGQTSMQSRINELLASRRYTGKGIGIVIKNLANDSVMVRVNEDTLYNPASVAKLLTAAIAFESLGPNHDFETRVFTDGEFDRESGVLKGNLYIKGTGDPGFTAERLWLMVQHLSHRGLNTIKGNLILDDSYFDNIAIGPGFDEDSSSRAYQPLISALTASFSTVAIHTMAGSTPGQSVKLRLFPANESVKITTSAKTVGQKKQNALDVVSLVDGEKTVIKVSGAMSVDDEPKYVYRKVWQTWQIFGGAIDAMFKECDIHLKGKIIRDVLPDSVKNSKPFYVFHSEPLSQYVNHMFKYSSNFASEMIFKTLSACSDSQQGSWQNSSKLACDWWRSRGLTTLPIVKNGSGMGNTNRFSTKQIVDLLSYVYKQKAYYPEYLSALSVSGIDGTLKTRFARSKLKGLVRGKTGTLNSINVSTLAGYLLLPQGDYAFAIFCNGIGNGQYDNWMMQEQILESFAASLYK